MNLSDLAIRRPVFTWMLMVALIVFGAIGFFRMGVSQLPDVDFPIVTVNVRLEGASPQVMEVDVVDPLEEAVLSVQGITGLSASARHGSASVTAEFDISKDIGLAVQEIESAVSGSLRQMPKDIDPPTVSKSSPEDHPILWLAVTADNLSPEALMRFVRDRLKDQFSVISGVSEVFLSGYVEPSLRVWLSNDQLIRYSLTVSDVINTIHGEHIEVPAGRLETATKEYSLRTLGEAPSKAEFENLSIIRRGGGPNFRPIPLKAVASVEEGLGDVRRRSRSQGNTAVGLGIRKQRGANSVGVASAVKLKCQEVQKSLPPGMKLDVRHDSTQFIEQAVGELQFTLVLAGIFTALVCWLFLGAWASTVNVILAIPTSIIGSFIVLNALGFTLNLFTLLGLSLAIGIVVDDTIMVLENIFRHREMGKNRRNAARDGALEIRLAAVATTAAIIAIFLPVAFMKGIVGRYFFQFGITLSVAVALSLLEALTLTPMRCSQFLEVSERKSRIGRGVSGFFEQSRLGYERLIPWLLERRWRTLLVAGAFTLASFGLFGLLNKEFVPAEDQGRLAIRVQAPLGSTLQYTDERVLQIEKYLKERNEVLQYFSGVGGFGGGDVNSAMVFVTLKPRHERGVDSRSRTLTQQRLIPIYREALKSIQGARVTVQDLSLSGFSPRRGFPVEFTVRGPNWDTLVESSQRLMDQMQKSNLVVDVDSDYQSGMPQISVTPNRERARLFGVSIADIGTTVNAMVGGVVAGKYSQDGRRYDVRVRLDEKFRRSRADIRKIHVRNNRGELVPLSEVVILSEQVTLQRISRVDRERAITVFANVAPEASQSEAIEMVRKLAATTLPEGYRAMVSGSSKGFGEAFSSLMFALILGLVVAYMVLASQFNSFIHPFTVFVALPFSIAGALIALYLTGQSLNLYSLIGILLLMGIVKKNSILLVEFTNQLRTQGMTVHEALLNACPNRLRPILMTSISTVAGALPAALAWGPGAESRVPMAIAVMGGVVVSTILTLFVVPCVYSLFSRDSAPGE